uniref:Uncharacterized protein n=1 Tax=Molossus molossus TaxID=27622 RepID=A0A7J8EEZ4_MOLMO|nr:hypothetical protein HJG59_008897 [Molossus molossus]
MFTSVGQVSHTMEGQSRPEVSEATWGFGDPGLGQGGIPSPKLPSLYRPPILKRPRMGKKVRFVNCDLEHSADVKCTRPDDLEPKEQSPGHQPRRQSQLSSIPGSPMQGQTRRGVQFQRPCHLQQPLQLQLWSRDRPGQPLLTWLRRPYPWLKDPRWDLPWFLPQRKGSLCTFPQVRLQSSWLRLLAVAHQENLFHPTLLTFSCYFFSFLHFWLLRGMTQSFIFLSLFFEVFLGLFLFLYFSFFFYASSLHDVISCK